MTRRFFMVVFPLLFLVPVSFAFAQQLNSITFTPVSSSPACNASSTGQVFYLTSGGLQVCNGSSVTSLLTGTSGSQLIPASEITSGTFGSAPGAGGGNFSFPNDLYVTGNAFIGGGDNAVLDMKDDNFGFVKKSGDSAVLAAGSNYALRFGIWSTATLGGNISSGTFTEVMRITNTGNVGIGTTAPGAKLDVEGGNILTSGTLTIGNGQSSAQISGPSSAHIWFPYTDNNVYFDSSNGFYFRFGGSSVVYFQTGGNVGIGTTAPGAKLDVSGDVYLGRQGTPISINSDFGSSGAVLGANEYYGSSSWNLFNTGQYGFQIDFHTASSSTPAVNFNYTAPGANPVSYTTVMSMYPGTGSVGLDLHNYRIQNVGTPVNANDAATKSYVDSAVATGVSGGVTGTSGYVAKFTGANTVGNSAIYQSGNNIGIGTTAPATNVTVSGSQGLLDLGANGWADPGATGGSIVVDNNGYKQMMIVGNNVSGNSGNGREVGVWDFLNVHGRAAIGYGNQTAAPASGLTVAGSVGIGVTNPQQSLEVSNLNNYQLRLGNGSGSSAYTYDIGRNGSDGLLYFYGNQTGYEGYVFTGVRGEYMRIANGGYVGIGTASPGTNLDVNGNIQSSIYYDRDNTNYYLDLAANTMPYALAINGLIDAGTRSTSHNYSVPDSCGGSWQTYVESGIWAPDYSTGCGDEWYVAEIQNGGTGEQSSLVINQSNDANDTVVISASGGVSIGGSPSPYSTVNFTVNGGTTLNGQVVLGSAQQLTWAGASSANSINMNGGSISGVNKITTAVLDPVYKIGGVSYATYGPDIIGLKTEAFGKVSLSSLPNATGTWEAVLDFSKAKSGSDLWLFWQTIHEGKDMKDVSVYLTPDFQGEVWYHLDPAAKQIVIYAVPAETTGAVPDLEVSYHLVAPRYDSGNWTNYAKSGEGGTTIPLK